MSRPIAIGGFLVSVISLGEAFALLFSVGLVCAPLSAVAADAIEKGSEDLLRNKTLSQPFTVFDQLLLGLDRKASEVAKNVRPEKSEFRPSRAVSGEARSSVAYQQSEARTVIDFGVTVSGMDDPWRDVCAKHIKNIVTFGLQLPYPSEWKQNDMTVTAFGFFSELLGPGLISDFARLIDYKPFSDSIVVVLRFGVENEKAKRLRFLRQCFWDNKTGQLTFRDHVY